METRGHTQDPGMHNHMKETNEMKKTTEGAYRLWIPAHPASSAEKRGEWEDFGKMFKTWDDLLDTVANHCESEKRFAWSMDDHIQELDRRTFWEEVAPRMLRTSILASSQRGKYSVLLVDGKGRILSAWNSGTNGNAVLWYLSEGDDPYRAGWDRMDEPSRRWESKKYKIEDYGKILGRNGAIDEDIDRTEPNLMAGRLKFNGWKIRFDTGLLNENERKEFTRGFKSEMGREFDYDLDECSSNHSQPWYSQTATDDWDEEERVPWTLHGNSVIEIDIHRENEPWAPAAFGEKWAISAKPLHGRPEYENSQGIPNAYELGRAWAWQLVANGDYDAEGACIATYDHKMELLEDLIKRAGMAQDDVGPCSSIIAHRDEDDLWRLNDDHEEIKGTFDGLCHWLRLLPVNAGCEKFWEEASKLRPNALTWLCRTCDHQFTEDTRLEPNQVLCLRHEGPKCSFIGNEPEEALGKPLDQNDTCDYWTLWEPEDENEDENN